MPASDGLHRLKESRMQASHVSLCPREREVVLDATRSVCEHESWVVHAVHVRSTHIHIAVSGKVKPEEVLGKLKAYSSRALNQRFGRRVKRWSRHGSTKWLWTAQEVDSAVQCVVHEQGRPMACYLNPTRWAEQIRLRDSEPRP